VSKERVVRRGFLLAGEQLRTPQDVAECRRIYLGLRAMRVLMASLPEDYSPRQLATMDNMIRQFGLLLEPHDPGILDREEIATVAEAMALVDQHCEEE
jgi:hypothetical protein